MFCAPGLSYNSKETRCPQKKSQSVYNKVLAISRIVDEIGLNNDHVFIPRTWIEHVRGNIMGEGSRYAWSFIVYTLWCAPAERALASQYSVGSRILIFHISFSRAALTPITDDCYLVLPIINALIPLRNLLCKVVHLTSPHIIYIIVICL